jgi:hypothetical protein
MRPNKIVGGPLHNHRSDRNTGEPLLPKTIQNKFVNYHGVLVRDRVPISVRVWKRRKDAPLINFVSDRDKDILWDSVTAHFTLLAGEDLRNPVKSWALKKMSTQF